MKTEETSAELLEHILAQPSLLSGCIGGYDDVDEEKTNKMSSRNPEIILDSHCQSPSLISLCFQQQKPRSLSEAYDHSLKE